MSDPLEGNSTTPNVAGLTGRNTAGGDGVFGAGAGGTAVQGENKSTAGFVVSHGFIAGTDPIHGEDAGAYGESSSQGVLGHSDIGTGVLGHTNSGFGVRGESPTGSGFIGGSDPIRHEDAGLYGESTKQGVLGHSDVGNGVFGHTNSGFAVRGESPAGTGFIAGTDPVSRQQCGVYGESGQSGVLGHGTADGAAGVHGTCQAANGIGVLGETVSGVGVQGQTAGPGLAGKFIGDLELDGVLQVPSDDGLHINAKSIRIHGSDVILDGRSGQGALFRALVDEGNKLIINFNGDYGQGVEIMSDLVLDGAMTVTGDEGLHLTAASVRIHGTDLIMDGRSGQGALFRALVDMGNKLIINFNGDYGQGVEVMSDLVVDGKVRSSGADCAEQFDLAADAAGEPGTVMVIGADGKLAPCATAYDSKVAGVVSGAGALKTAFVLNDQAGHRAAIALMGTVYCWVDASRAPVSAGDLLTTSPTPGHAMRAVDADRRFGAVVGKALGTLADGTGLIPILVAPQ
jgi:hypothetical protein